jgi:hypothetical protein
MKTAEKIKNSIPERQIFINVEGRTIVKDEIYDFSDSELDRLESWLAAERIMILSAKEQWSVETPGYDPKKNMSYQVKLNAINQFLQFVQDEILKRNQKGQQQSYLSEERIQAFINLVTLKLGKETVSEMWEVVDNRLACGNY